MPRPLLLPQSPPPLLPQSLSSSPLARSRRGREGRGGSPPPPSAVALVVALLPFGQIREREGGPPPLHPLPLPPPCAAEDKELSEGESESEGESREMEKMSKGRDGEMSGAMEKRGSSVVRSFKLPYMFFFKQRYCTSNRSTYKNTSRL